MVCILLAVAQCALAGAQTVPANATQRLVFDGLRSAGLAGQINAVATDAGGDLYLAYDQRDGVRVLKVANGGSAILAQAHLGAAGDSAVALSLDAGGNVYIAGTSSSGSLAATSGARFGSATPGTTNSFVAKFDASLDETFLTFTGGTRIAASAIAVSGDRVFVTGIAYGSDLPATANAIEPMPAYQSTENGFVESFSNDGSTLVYATYVTGASGTTTPTGIAVDTADDAWLVGSTSATGFPTIAALVPNILSNPSGFLMRLTPGGDGIAFSTFVPGEGLNSIALDAAGSRLLITGSVALGQFPVDTVFSPLVPTTYQVLLSVALDGSSVAHGTVIVPGTESVAVPVAGGSVWVGGEFGQGDAPMLPQPALAEIGTGYAVRVTAAGAIDQTVRLGGVANQQQSYAGIPVSILGLAVDGSGSLFAGGSVQPTASASLLGTETYDFPLAGGPTAAFPSAVADALPAAGSCTGSGCSGSAGFLAKVDPAAASPALSWSIGDLPFAVLRNLGSAAATGLQLTASAGTVASTCGDSLAAGGECDALLSGGGAGTLTASIANGNASSVTFAAYSASPPADTLVFTPKELDFGVQSSVGTAAARTIAVSNLGSASETFASGIPAAPESATPFSEASSDCALSGTMKVLAAGATCHIQVQLNASSSSANDGFVTGEWSIGQRQLLLTGYTQAAALSVSATEVDFGTQFQGGLALPRYLYLSNSSSTALAHTRVSLPATSPFTVTDGCPSQLPGGTVCRIRLDYQSAVVPSSDTAGLTLDAGIAVLVTGSTMPQPSVGGSSGGSELTVSATSVAFPTAVPVTGVSSATQTVAIANAGTSASPLGIALNGDFIGQSSCGTTLAAGATCAVAIQFTPSQPGARQGLLTVSAGTGVTAATVALSGTGTAILPANNGTLAFGGEPVGQPEVEWYKVSVPFNQLTVAATGPFLVTLSEDTGAGHGNPPSSEFVAQGTGTCYNCWIGVRFQPPSAGAQNGTLSVSSVAAGLPYVLELTGSGIATSGLILTPAVQDFGSIPVNSGSGPVLFTMTNLTASQTPVTVSPAALTGNFGIGTALNPGAACSGTLAYAASCTLAVVFEPTTAGPQTGTVTVTTSGGSVSAQLTGNATADPGIGIAPLALTFLNGAAAASTLQTVTVTNTGSVAVTVGAPATATSSFTETSNCANLAPGASCQIAVTFAPGATPVTDTLSIPVSSPGSGGVPESAVYQVALTGAYTAGSVGLAISPASVSYGPNATSTVGTSRLFTIQNLTSKQLSLNIGMPANYAVSGTPCTALAPGASCVEEIEFVPLVNGDLPGTLTIQAVPADGSATIASLAYLDGYGVGTGALAIGGGLIVNGGFNFGTVAPGQSISQSFVLANRGAAGSPAFTVRRIASAAPFLSTNNCGSALAVGESCNVTVTYTPAGGSGSSPATTDVGSLIIQSDAQSSPDTLNLTGETQPGSGSTAVLATFTLSEGSLTFPATVVGNSSPAQAVTLTNTGNVPILVVSVNPSADFSVRNGCTTVDAGATCTMQVTATPQATGTRLGALEIATTGTASLEFVSLISTGVASPLSLSPASLAFGNVQVGTQSVLPISVTNNSSSPIQIQNIAGSANFAVGGTCPTGGGTLAPLTSCTAEVTFTPSSIGAETGTISFNTSVSTVALTVPATGTGVAAQLLATPGSLAFGSIALGGASILSVTLTNAGTAAATGLTATTIGDYAVTSPCAQASLAPGASCVVQVTFSPTATGARTGTLSVASSDPHSPLTIPLSGTGISNATFTLSVNGGSSATLTVASGSYATYALLLTPVGTFGGNVALTCGAVTPGQYAACSIQPSQVSLGSGPQASAATISTLASPTGVGELARPALGHPTRTFFAFLVPGVLLMMRRRRNLRVWLGQAVAIAGFLGLLMLSGCGGGNPNLNYTPPGTYRYIVTANSTSGVQITQSVTLNLVVTAR